MTLKISESTKLFKDVAIRGEALDYGITEMQNVSVNIADKNIKTSADLENFSPFRERVADRTISDIQKKLSISFQGKTCVDIGCRSGENMLAMQKAGAKVIGIDPDDEEFAIARAKGIENEQLVKATLQKYQSSMPNQKFDVATVFLWSIPYKERELFFASLAKIIHPEGYVIIGYYDEAYDKGSSNILDPLRKVFHNVARHEFNGSINRYMLKCSL